MSCSRCVKRGKDWEGDDPHCAFESGTFTSDNWNCATMNDLRRVSGMLGLTWRGDNAAASFGFVPSLHDDFGGYIAMSWYKSRGTTGMAVFMQDDFPPKALTLEQAESALSCWTLRRVRGSLRSMAIEAFFRMSRSSRVNFLAEVTP